jgi:hypothetical protein|tara:strand:- start:7260 stop:7373 length:114 start_codon:yes stop_codon:yes gene_type:complete
MTDFRNLVNVSEGLQRGEMYSSREIYQLELERIFARS